MSPIPSLIGKGSKPKSGAAKRKLKLVEARKSEKLAENAAPFFRQFSSPNNRKSGPKGKS